VIDEDPWSLSAASGMKHRSSRAIGSVSAGAGHVKTA